MSIATDPRTTLQQYFGYDEFRPGQRELIEAVVAGRDCLGVMPTGAGKSVCYQVPALAFDGVTIVVSPLVSLMNDQVSALVDAGIPAAYVNSQLPAAAQADVLDAAATGHVKLLYVAPERLDDPRFRAFACSTRIPFIAIDEAHCVSQWGQDFRPSYLRIADFIADIAGSGEPGAAPGAAPGTAPACAGSGLASRRPVIAAYTATATPRVADDIVRLLGLRDPLRLSTGFDRPNLHFSVEQLGDRQKAARVEALVRENAGESGIVYCSTRRHVDALAADLAARGLSVTRYHAGLSAAVRTANQRDFVNDDALVMVATNAFGMGIDKSNVRYVIHYNMPGSLEAYYQEAGRAGRDGEPAACLLLWNDSDIATCRFFIESDIENDALTSEEAEVVRAAQRRRLAAMAGYCMTTDCLRATILRYFGDELPAPARPEQRFSCRNCSNCENPGAVSDVTVLARSVMRCVHEVRGRFGKGIVADILTGSKSAKIREYGLDTARTYDIVDASPATVKEVIELLAVGEYLEISEGKYPLVGLGPRAREAATDEFRLYMKRKPKAASRQAATRGKPKVAVLDDPADRELFERLRDLRKRIASEEGVPPYIVFSDSALRSMCLVRPTDEAEFLLVNGVGQTKLARYGARFLAEINCERPM